MPIGQASSAPYDARAVANLFLDLAEEANVQLTQMQLLKLVYFASGWYLARRAQPLISQDFQAWEHGPVVKVGGDVVESASTSAASAANDAAATRVFVVHGHDEASREQLERILMILGLDPFVLQNTSGGGMTIIEALEQQIGKEPEAKFGIVLMTPDDMGYSNRDGEAAVQPRARQNVVMEMGMLLSSLTRERVAILVKGHVEQPSDAHGIIYLHFNNHVKEVVPRLTERLRAVGFDIAPSQITKAAS